MENLKIDYEAGLIKVKFKDTYSDKYVGNAYTYLPYEGVEIGDIVVVNTKNGKAIAKVVEKNIYESEFDYEKLATVEYFLEKGKNPKEEHLKKMQNLKLYNKGKEYIENFLKF